MSGLLFETFSRISAERILNALPEGLLIAFFAWAFIRALGRQNSGTRFAVWFLALLTVAIMPFLGGFGDPQVVGTTSLARMQHGITLPGNWALFIFLFWAAGACVGLTRLVGGLWRLHHLRQSCTLISTNDLDASVRKTLDSICARRSGFAGRIQVATSEQLRVPAAIGLWKRTIVLPAWALLELSADDLNVILLHESAHLRRGDDWTNLIQKIIRALFFFHPAVWWIESRLSVEREMACDDAVLAETANPRGYAACLLSLLEKGAAQRGWSMAQAAVARAREASLRLTQILDQNRTTGTRLGTPALAAIGAFFVVCLTATPHVPQFVTINVDVDRGVTAAENASTMPENHMTAKVVPASFHLDESHPDESFLAASKKPKPSPVRAIGNAAIRTATIRVRPEQRLLADFAAELPLEATLVPQMVALNADARQELMPPLQTVVLVETTQFVIADSSLWRVQVWRVLFVNTNPQRTGLIPVVDSI